MKKRTVALIVLISLVLIVVHSSINGVAGSAAASSTVGAGKNGKVPAVLKFPSYSGEVTFPHRYHFEELEIECKTCHHETNAARLRFPHENYFKDFWIDCRICHHEAGKATLTAQACSKCHHGSPASIADETLSSKVVIHKRCWQCHEIGKGREATITCKFCHNGPRLKF